MCFSAHLRSKDPLSRVQLSVGLSLPSHLVWAPASGQLSAFGAVCYAAVIAITVPTCLRINKQVARGSIENPPGDWAAVRARWIRFHVIRTLFSVPAFALYAAAMILRTT